MVNIKNNLFVGNKIIYLNEPYNIEFVDFIKPGKGKPFVRIKIRNLINLKLIDKTFKFLKNIKIANIYNYNCNYIYFNNKSLYFLNLINLEQVVLTKDLIGNKIIWLYKNNIYNIIFWNNIPINLIIPKIIKIKVIFTDFIINKNTNKKYKLAKLINGVYIKVPFFINIGDLIKVNTYKKLYISRYIKI